MNLMANACIKDLSRAGTLAALFFLSSLADAATVGFGDEPEADAVPVRRAKVTVRNIYVRNEGGPVIDEDLIIAHVGAKKGDEFSPPQNAESMKSLYETGLFDFVVIDPELDAGAGVVDLKISYISRPLLTGIYFNGNREWASGVSQKELSRYDYRRFIVDKYNGEDTGFWSNLNFFRGRLITECTNAGLLVGKPLDRNLIMRAVSKIKKKYSLKFPFAEVAYEIKEDEATGTAIVIFNITENLNTKINRISFDGNETFDDQTLRNLLDTATWAYTIDPGEWPSGRFMKFSGLRDLGRFDYEKYRRDLVKIQNFYQNAGFLDCKVYGNSKEELAEGYESVNNTETEGWLPIDIRIIEGPRYFVGDISVEGNRLGKEFPRFKSDAIVAMLASRSPRGVRKDDELNFDWLYKGMPYSPQAAKVAIEKIRDYYGQVGYLDCQVTLVREPDVDTGLVSMKFKIDEGEKSYLRSIRIDGNTITRSDVILRELVLAPGEVFDSVRMKTSEARLKNTSYWRQPSGQSSISLTPVNTPVANQKDLLVRVTEAATGAFSMGAGFSTVESLSAYVEFSQSNFDLFNYRNYFRGGGQKFRARVQVGTRSTRIEQSFEEPMIYGREIAAGYDAYYKSDNFVSSDYNTKDAGVKFYGRRRLFERVTGTLYWKIDNYEIDDISSSCPRFVWDEAGYTFLSRGGFTLSRDTRDNYLFPTSGGKIELTNELVGGPFGGQCDFYHLRFQASKYFPLFDFQDQTIRLRFRADTTHAFGNSYVPFFEKIKYGGPYTLRGFKYSYVSPFEGDEPRGGDSGAFVSAEYSIKLLDNLRFSLFYDGGFVNEDSFDWEPDDWCDNVGFGFKLLIMGSLLNLDLGFPIHATSDNDDGMRFNISFGTNF
ncbi:MAG: outer membrane protein assembly factor BamA [Opitutales bacterium]|nr:outer membrane protein assembly factor BamA [Opitutales bacterium]